MAAPGCSKSSDVKTAAPQAVRENAVGGIDDNLSELKYALHGTSYQLKLAIAVCLANAKKAMNPANKFDFKVTAEDPTAGKFDDIMYEFQDGAQTGTLKIQAKHKTESPAKITVDDFLADPKNDFYIDQYFKSFRDQQQQQQENDTSLEGLIICTNSYMDDAAKEMWEPIDPAVNGISPSCVDFSISTIFNKVGGTCYQLKSNYKRAMLAKLLIKAIKSKEEMVTSQIPLLKDYRLAIVDIIENPISVSERVLLFMFSERFLSCDNSSPSYDAFRKEFEQQYRQEFQLDGSVWDDLKQKRLFVEESFLFDEENRKSSSDSFPDDNVDESVRSFCERFRLVCGTKDDERLDDAIAKLWRTLYSEDIYLTTGQRKGDVEEYVPTEKLFKTIFVWLVDPFAKPLFSGELRKYVKNIKSTLAHIKLKGISDKLSKLVLGSPFQIRSDALKASELYERLESESILEVETYDIEFCATLLLDTLALLGKDNGCILFIDDSYLINDSNTVEKVLRCIVEPIYLTIICYEALQKVQSIVQMWQQSDILNGSTKQVILVSKTNNNATDLSCFCVRDVTEESWNQFLQKHVPLCSTNILATTVFQNGLEAIPIEKVIEQLERGRQMETNNDIVQKYRCIENTYVQRCWIDKVDDTLADNPDLSDRSYIINNIYQLQGERVSFMKLIEPLKSRFDTIIQEERDEHEPIVESAKKVQILLGEAGLGKSTNLTWLAWHLQETNPSSWVFRCNLSDHCTNFMRFTKRSRSQSEKYINESEALRMLYELIYLSLTEMVGDDRLVVRSNARKCSKYLGLSDRKVVINKQILKQQRISLSESIHLQVFKEKFNSGELVLLFDGFDEITPLYRQVLKYLSHLAQFDGVRKLYLTSHPYNFQQQFKGAFVDPSFYQLKPLSILDKGTMLYKMMKAKSHNVDIDDREISGFYKALCVMLLCSLHDKSDAPLNLMISVDSIVRQADRYVHIPSKTFNTKLLQVIENISNASCIVEKHVDFELFVNKNEANLDAADTSLQNDRYESDEEETKLKLGLVALLTFFDKQRLDVFLSKDEILEATDYMKSTDEVRGNVGIINGVQDGVPMFIHRSFAEYLAAWWIVKRVIEAQLRDQQKISILGSLWEQHELRKHIDTILAKRYPLHLAIIDKDWKTVKSLLSTNPQAINERDDGNRTPLHLLSRSTDQLDFLPKSIESDIINGKDFSGWTALDYAFHDQNSVFISYLLHHGASINVDVLYELVASPGQNEIRNASRYSKYVMEYLSRYAIDYESNDACKTMKQFCDRVVRCLINKKRISRTVYLNYIIDEDSVWMLESITQQKAIPARVTKGIRTFFSNLNLRSNFGSGSKPLHFPLKNHGKLFDMAQKAESLFVLKYLVQFDPSLLNGYSLWKCMLKTVVLNYKIEFKWFLDLYCSRVNFQDFEPCSMRCEGDETVHFLSNTFDGYYKTVVGQYQEHILENVSADIIIDQSFLSLLVLCVVYSRPSMLKYWKESCKLNFSVGLANWAMGFNKMFTPIKRSHEIEEDQIYEYMFNQASNISNKYRNEIEAKNVLLTLTADLCEMAKSQIERQYIDIEALDASISASVVQFGVPRPSK